MKVSNMEYSGNFKIFPISIGILIMLATGCASNDEIVDSNYGDSVRHMIAVQTSHPNRGVTGLDGQKAALTLQNYRTDVATPKEVDTKELGTSKATANVQQ